MSKTSAIEKDLDAILASDRPGIVTATKRFEEPAVPVNLPSYTDGTKEGRSWSFYPVRDGTLAVVASTAATINHLEAAILHARNNGVINYPRFEAYIPSRPSADGLSGPEATYDMLQVSHRAYDALWSNVAREKTAFADTPTWLAIHVGTPAAIRRALLSYAPSTVLFGGYGSHFQGQGKKGGTQMSKPPKVTALIEGAVTGKSDMDLRTSKAIGPRMGAGAFLPPYSLSDAAHEGKASEVGLGSVPLDLTNVKNQGAVPLRDLTWTVQMPLARLLDLTIGDDEDENRAVRRYFLALFLFAVQYKETRGYDFRKGCVLAGEPVQVRYDGKPVPSDLKALAAEVNAATSALESRNLFRAGLLDAGEQWVANDDFAKKFANSHFKKAKKGEAAE